MPYVRKRKTTTTQRKAYRKKNVAKKRRVYRKRTIAPLETACIKETLQLSDLEPNQPYEPELQLSMFPRALDIADNYQKYRIQKVEYIYKPRYDTFQSQYEPGTSNVNPTVPYLFSKVLNYPSPTAFGLQFLQSLGAKPRRLDDKNLIVTYKPHVLQQGLVNQSAPVPGSAANSTSRAIRSPWLNTHWTDSSGVTQMDNTYHYGHVFYIQQEVVNPTGLYPVAELDVNVYFEFCKPWDLATQTVGAKTKKDPFNVNN